MTASTAPTQPPDKCPACGEPLLGIEDVIGLSIARYECGRKLTRGVNYDWTVYNSCPSAEAETIALRAERDAALARVVELQAVCDAARQYVELYQQPKIIPWQVEEVRHKLRAALASGAVVEGEVK